MERNLHCDVHVAAENKLTLPPLFTYGVFGTTGKVVPTSDQVVETTCECSVVSTTDFYQLGGSVQLQLLNHSCSATYYPYHEIQH